MNVIFYFFGISSFGLVLGSPGSDRLFGSMKDVVDKYEESDDTNLEQIFSYTVRSYICIQVVIDGSTFSIMLLKIIHQTETIRPVVVSYTDEFKVVCKAFVVVAKAFYEIKGLIDGLPLHAGNRMILFVDSTSKYLLNNFLKGNVTIFENIDVFLVSSDNYNVGYRMGQATRRFKKVQNMTTPWSTVNRSLNFHKRTINVLTYNCSIFSAVGPRNNQGVPSYERGIEMDLFKDIAGRLNLTYMVQVPESFENEHISAMFYSDKWYEEPLKQKDANGSDIAFCCLLNSVKRRRGEISISEPLQLICFRFLVPRPRLIDAQWNSIFRPFAYDLWFTIAIAIAVTTFILQRVVIVSRRYLITNGIKRYTEIGGSFLQLLSMLVLSSVPQSKEPQGPSRYLLTCWALFTMIISTSFCSSLASNLSTQLHETKLDDIDDFIKTDYSWLYLKKPDFEEMFNVENKDQARWSVRGKLAKSIKEYQRLLEKGKYVLWGAQIDRGFLLPHEEHVPPDLLKNYEAASDCFIEYFTGFAFKVGSSFEFPFNRLIQTYRESGLITKILKDKNRERKKKYPYVFAVLSNSKSKLAGAKSLTARRLIGIFEIWAAGALLSIVVFLLEVCQKFKI